MARACRRGEMSERGPATADSCLKSQGAKRVAPCSMPSAFFVHRRCSALCSMPYAFLVQRRCFALCPMPSALCFSGPQLSNTDEVTGAAAAPLAAFGEEVVGRFSKNVNNSRTSRISPRWRDRRAVKYKDEESVVICKFREAKPVSQSPRRALCAFA